MSELDLFMIDEYSTIIVSDLKKANADEKTDKPEEDKPKFKSKKAVME